MKKETLITMTTGVSLKLWEETGLIDRELAYYRELSEQVGPLVFLSYGKSTEEENLILKRHIPSARAVCVGSLWTGALPYGEILTGFLSPVYSKEFKNCGLIRSNQFLGSWAGVLLAKTLKVPFILRCGYLFNEHYLKGDHPGRIRQKVFQKLEHWVAKQADEILVTYPLAKDYFVRSYGVDANHVTVLGNPIDLEVFSPKKVIKSRDVVSIGRFEDQKNYPALLEACANLRLTLTLYGKGHHEKNLKELSETLSLDLKFAGRIPNHEVPEALAKHRIFALPSHYEGNPKALLEAMACGMAVVASDIPEHQSIIRHGENGLLCGRNAADIAHSLRQLIEDENLREKLGQAARKHILKHHEIHGLAQKEASLHGRLTHTLQ